MTKLSPYLKPFLPGIFLAVLLLFAQSIAELALPNRMSDIVNVGLQQSGIEHASPDAISPEGFALMLSFMPEDEKEYFAACYTEVAGDAADEKGRAYRSLYPNAGETVFVKNAETKSDEETLGEIDRIFGNAAYTAVMVMQAAQKDMTAADGQSASGSETFDMSSFDFDIGMAYMLFKNIDAAAIKPYIDSTVDAEASGVTGVMGAQVGVMFAKAFYEELGADTSAMQTEYIRISGLYMLLIALGSGAAAVAVGYIAPWVAAGASKNLRRDLFAKVESFSHHEFDKFSSASLITRCTNDVQQVQMLVGMGIRMLIAAPITGIGGIIMALAKAPSMSWIIALAVIVLLGLVTLVSLIALPKFKTIQKMIDNLNKISRETLNGLPVIRAFGTQKHEMKRFADANRDMTDINLFVSRVMAVVMPVITFIMSGTSLIIVWVGAKQISESGMQIGDMLAFMQYAIQVIMSFMMLSMMLIMIPRAAVSGDRINEVLATELSIKDPPKSKELLPEAKGRVEFKNVSFRYGNAEDDVISDINFTAMPGQTTAIIGATGSGKTTIANLLLRFYDVTGGSISVGGADVRDLRQHDLRQIIGYVPQKGQLLTGTIASNIKYGRPDASEKDVEEAASVAQAAGFVNEKEGRFDSEIAQAGANVSGGQRQRLSIARALAKKPRVLVFDDSFSALDFKTDAELRRALKQSTADATVIVIAQRVGTIMNAEQIIVLDQGKIVGRGTHEELYKNCPTYYEIASSQLESGNETNDPASVSKREAN